jgi:hypothetical protein
MPVERHAMSTAGKVEERIFAASPCHTARVMRQFFADKNITMSSSTILARLGTL